MMLKFDVNDFEVGDYVVIDEPVRDHHMAHPLFIFFIVDYKDTEKNELYLMNPKNSMWMNDRRREKYADGTALRKPTAFETLLMFMNFYTENSNVARFFKMGVKPSNSDDALIILFNRFRNEINQYPLDDRFHVNFRQIDVTMNGAVDSTIHTLLNDAPLFWHLFEQHKEEME